MLTKTQPDELQDFLLDASHMHGGFADRVVFPDSASEVAAFLAEASASQTPVTISGAGTGTVGGRVPFGGTVLATDKLNQIANITRDGNGGRATVQAGVRLNELQRAVETEKLFYPPDPTEGNCFIGGTVATNASGARTFKYGSTRDYVTRLQVALSTGEIIDLRRGEFYANTNGQVRIPCSSGRVIEAQLPSYQMPSTRKHAAAYFVAPEMDVIDLFIGSEGTLGVVVEAELKLLPKPAGVLSGVIFFGSEDRLLEFVRDARAKSLMTRQSNSSDSSKQAEVVFSDVSIDARVLEFFDQESLGFLRQKYETIPEGARGAIFFEQEINALDEEPLMAAWLHLIEQHQALADDSWFATNESDQTKLREFRHQLPVLMNEWFARYAQQKVSTDMAVPDEHFPAMLRFYQDALRGGDLRYTIFGHIGDNHVHVNILPRDDNEAGAAREIYVKFIRRAVELGGTISAEHGIGKLKREYLRELYGERHIREMAALKQAFDPAGILGRGNMFCFD
jgi:D-lactate dehydrogenase (cytochrome)